MQAEIMMIGTELLLGQIEDTNATFMARVLAENGINLFQKTTVGDNTERINAALNAALDRSDIVLCSGGLGPTEDDLTRECVAAVTGRPLEFDPYIWEQIEAMFARFRFKITENNKRQAMVPRGAIVVQNPRGSAPGLIVEDPRGIIACMPGVPHELKFMLTEKIVPYLRDKIGMKEVIHYRVLKVCGLGESRVDEAIADLITNSKNPTVGVLANPAFVRIRITAKAGSIPEADALIDEMDIRVRERLPDMIMGVNDETLEGVVNRMLVERGWTLAVAETASGGMISQRLTAENAGQFVGGKVVPHSEFDPRDAEKTALDMARRVLVEFAASGALAVAADPGEGQAVAAFVYPGGEQTWAFGRAGTDERLQLRTCVVALEYVRRHLAALPRG